MTRNNGESDPYFRRVKYSQSKKRVSHLRKKMRRERKRSIEKRMAKVLWIFLKIFPSYNYPRLIMTQKNIILYVRKTITHFILFYFSNDID